MVRSFILVGLVVVFVGTAQVTLQANDYLVGGQFNTPRVTHYRWQANGTDNLLWPALLSTGSKRLPYRQLRSLGDNPGDEFRLSAGRRWTRVQHAFRSHAVSTGTNHRQTKLAFLVRQSFCSCGPGRAVAKDVISSSD